MNQKSKKKYEKDVKKMMSDVLARNYHIKWNEMKKWVKNLKNPKCQYHGTFSYRKLII